MTMIETRTMHFDLSSFPHDKQYTLLADGKEHKLGSYKNHPEKLAEHRSQNRALAMIGERELPRISHFVEKIQFNATRACMHRVVFPSLDDHPLPEIAICYFHIPARHVAKAFRSIRALKGKVSHPLALSTYGVQEHRLAAMSAKEIEEVYVHAASFAGPNSTAQTIVLNHPELGSTNGVVAQQIVDQYLQYSQSFSELVQYIQTHPPGSGDGGWYNKSWVMWAQNDDGTGPMVPCEVNEDLQYKDGGKPDWPTPPGGKAPGMPTYNLTDVYEPPVGPAGPVVGDGGVIEAAGPCVSSVLRQSKNDPLFNGLLYNRPTGTTSEPQTNVPPDPKLVEKPSPKVTVAGNAAAEANGFGIKNKTSTYGLYLYNDELNFDFDKKTLTFPVKNWPARYLGAYVEFHKQDGSVIPRDEIKASNPIDPSNPYKWINRVPVDIQLVRDLAESSPTKNYLTWLSSGAAIFGAPTPFLTQTTNLDFLWPDDASTAMVLMGGLGVADGFSDWDTSVDLVGVLGTGIVCYGVSTIMLVLTVYVINPLIAALEGGGAIAFYFVAGILGAGGVVFGLDKRDTSAGKFVLSKLASIAAGAVFGALAKKAADAAGRALIRIILDASAELVAKLTAQEVLQCVPVVGWALKVVSIAANVSGLAATTVECLLSPATYQIEVLRTMDLTVTLSPDPTHGKDGFKPVWPLVSDHYLIQVTYPSTTKGSGGTTYSKSGPMPGAHDEPITVVFTAIPAGGKIEVTGNVYSNTNWLCGAWNGGWINALPDANSKMSTSGAIVEMLVPLTSDTTYSQKQTIAYSNAAKHYWEVTNFGVSSTLVPDFNKGGKPDAAITAAFAENGNVLSASALITIVTVGSSWTLADQTQGNNYAVKLRQLPPEKAFTTSYATYGAQLNKGGNTPSDIVTLFKDEQFPLPAGTVITVVTPNSEWSIGLPGDPRLYGLKMSSGDGIDVFGLSFLLDVQNILKVAPPLPAVYPLPPSPTGHALGAVQNIIINNHEFELGYAWMASGQNLPLDDGTAKSNVPMYTMQSISTLGQPQKQIIQPTRGFSLPSFLAYNQFGLTPIFPLGTSYIPVLKDGPVPAAIVKEFADFGITLPTNAEVKTIKSGMDWTIGVPNEDPLYELLVINVLIDAKNAQQIGVFSWPVPKMDNFYLDPRDHTAQNPVYYLRGVNLDGGESSEFDYSKEKAWGRISDPDTIQGLCVHPQGYVVAIDYKNHKLFTLKLPAEAQISDQSQYAIPLSGEGLMEGLMQNPTAMTVSADGRILILEEGNRRVQAFDVKGNPVPSFALQSAPPWPLVQSFIPDLDNRNVTMAMLKVFQQSVLPALAPKFTIEPDEEGFDYDQIVKDLNAGIVGEQLVGEFIALGYVKAEATSTDFAVEQNVESKLWIITNKVDQATYDTRVLTDEYGLVSLNVFACFSLDIRLVSKSAEWTINDTTNAMNFDVKAPGGTKPLAVQQVVSWMPLRVESKSGLTYLDVATETKGYIYVLSVLQTIGQPEFRLDIYNPDGTVLTPKPQVGVNAGKITVDQYRSMFTLNFNVVLGPGDRTEPGVSTWMPSTPSA